MANTRVELPRDHWVEVRDPWDITEKERNELTARLAQRARASAPATSVTPGTPGADEGDLEERLRFRTEGGHYLVTHLVTAWGGPLLDDKPIAGETLDDLPAPLFSAIDAAVVPVLQELFPRSQLAAAGNPTTP